MYVPMQGDKPRELQELPQSSVGAPCPMLIAGEHSLLLAYYLQETPEDWNGDSLRIVSDTDADEPCMLIRFECPYAHMFGPPNDKAFHGHPLARHGLKPYAAFEVEDSSWIHALERMNSVHPYHRPERFSEYRHFIFAFHDSTFECIARDFSISLARGSVWSVISAAQNK